MGHRFSKTTVGIWFAFIAVAFTLSLALPQDADAQRKKRKRRECVDCHKDFKKVMDRRFKHDPVEDGCETCHKRHGFSEKLVLVKAPPELCTDCHEDVKTEMEGKIVHGALSEGGCTTCHDPHASDEPALMRKASKGNSLCLRCHDTLNEAFNADNVHEPFAKDDCESCHAPHASNFPSLLIASEANVCQTCHENVLSKHSIPDVGDFSCSDCHNPHESSKSQPLSTIAHEPFASGECDACHDQSGNTIEMADDFPAIDLCSDCHDDVTETVAGGESHFGSDALAAGGTTTCLECHNPHESGMKSLLLKSENDLCRSCHTGLPQYGSHEGPIHQPFLDGDCTTCHEPHGGGQEAQLNTASDELCVSCHQNVNASEEGATRHEAMDDYGCIDCHSGHGTENIALLVESFGATCLTCHDKTQHETEHPPYLTSSCEACHSNHSTLPALLPAPVNDTCGRCHEEQLQAFGAQFPHEGVEGEDCLMCHQAHGSAAEGLLNQPERDVCADCHDVADLVVELDHDDGGEHAMALHTPVAKGDCHGCHDPHGSSIDGLLKREGQNLCYGCHLQEKVDFATGRPHDPVAEGKCDACHAPHGSTGAQLAAQTEPGMCTQCHDFADESLANRHQGYDVSGSRCSACHTPHNSAVDNLLNTVVHSPFEDDDCESCHDGVQETPGIIAAASLNTCMDCHDEKEDEAGHHRTEGLTCIDCHEPHAARFDGLLGDLKRTCTQCHSDVIAGDGSDAVHMHGPIEDGSCLDCHQMHAPESAGLLFTGQRELCGNCHETVREQVANKNLHDPFAKGECSECHSTHVSSQLSLLSQPEEELCAKCHNYSDAKMKSAHNNFELSGEGCASCHDPHSTPKAGSALLLPILHSPYEDQDCDVCHDSSGKVTASLDACSDCHDSDNNFDTVHNGGRSVNDKRSIGVCLDCHSPHAGHDALMVRSSMTETCSQCHEKSEFTRTNVHGALEDGCNACHDVHTSNAAVLTGAEVDDTCYDCHADSREHRHPIGSEYKDPRTGKAMTCVSCHEPHSSNFEHLVTFDHQRDLCVQCHASGTMKVQNR